MRIVETDKLGSEYPNEKFLNLPNMSHADALVVAKAINGVLSGPESSRYWKVVHDNYELQKKRL